MIEFKLEPKTIHIDSRVENLMKQNSYFRQFVRVCLGRYMHADWGNCSENEQKSNDKAVLNGGTVAGRYSYSPSHANFDSLTLWIVTSGDRTKTTIQVA